MDTIITTEAKHIFIDIVNYTYNRSVEAQADIIKELNIIVSESIKEYQIKRKCTLFIPTGDGMCISFINLQHPFDIHLQVSLKLLEKLYLYNEKQVDEMRKFGIRVGLNENIDNLIIDINGRQNISGSGINIASRIQSLADINQILVGRSVYDKLISREKYWDSFQAFSTIVKHGLRLSVYQFKDSGLKFLNNDTPTAFQPKKTEEIRLSEQQAFYIGHCIANESFIISKITNSLDTSTLHSLVYFATLDSMAAKLTKKTDPNYVRRVTSNYQDFFNELRKSNIWLTHEIRHTLLPGILKNINSCFSEPYLIVNVEGKNRLKKDWPEVYDFFIL